MQTPPVKAGQRSPTLEHPGAGSSGGERTPARFVHRSLLSMSIAIAIPPAFLPVDAARSYLGVSRTKLYRLAQLDPSILVQCEGRTLVDIARATALIASMPRGPRKPLRLPRFAKRRTP
jgi:hypothetical protein